MLTLPCAAMASLCRSMLSLAYASAPALATDTAEAWPNCIDITTKEGAWRFSLRRRVKRKKDPELPPCPPERSWGMGRALQEVQFPPAFPPTRTAEFRLSPVFLDVSCAARWQEDVFVPRLVTYKEMEHIRDKDYMSRLGRKEWYPNFHRKQWEYGFLLKITDAIGLGTGHKALGFAVGEEPTMAYFASLGVDVVATDVPPDTRAAKVWSGGHMYMNPETMNENGVATKEAMEKHVKIDYLDFNAAEQSRIWTQRGTFDFLWSICAVEHAGSIENGLNFMINSLQFLKPGGTAVHTTEFNVESLGRTIERGNTVIFRQRDSEALRFCAIKKGYQMPEICYDAGNTPFDTLVDLPPYGPSPPAHGLHTRLYINSWNKMDRYVSTCIGWVFKKPLDWVDNGYDCAPLFASVMSREESNDVRVFLLLTVLIFSACTNFYFCCKRCSCTSGIRNYARLDMAHEVDAEGAETVGRKIV